MAQKKPIYGFLAMMKLGQIAAYDSHLNPAARRILSIITGHANQEEYCWPSQGQIARDLGITRQAVNKQVSILESQGYLERIARTDSENGRTMNSVYVLNGELARKYGSEPTIFKKENLDKIAFYLATLWHLGGMNSQEVYDLETTLSDTKKKEKQNIKKSINRMLFNAKAWKAANQHHQQNGFSQEELEQIAELQLKVRRRLTARQNVEFDIRLRIAAHKQSTGDRGKYMILALQEKLREVSEHKKSEAG